MRVFISHASEDKASFARPLAEALRVHFDVWYDEYEFTIGDSLFKKVNEGLASCDYGVVILSPAFFQKKWTQAELDGLFALEGPTRKMILPIWKDISVEIVRSYSPILAGRLGANAGDGIQKVVSEIRRAIEVSNRTREISATDSVIQRARRLDQTLQERSNHERLSHSEEGVAIVKAGFHAVCSTIEMAINEVTKTSQILKLNVVQGSHPIGPLYAVHTNSAITLHILLAGLGGNYTDQSQLIGIIFMRNIKFFGSNDYSDRLKEFKFSPIFKTQSQLAWTDSSRQKVYSSEELSSVLLESLLNEVQRRGLGY